MNTVFLVGVPRSGTTWLQLILYQHPRIATAQETHLFDWYIAKLQQVWEREERRQVTRGVGLRNLMTEAEYEDVLGHFAHRVMDSIAARKPAADIILEKTPEHIEHWALIHELFPKARFIHLIRDPRAVVASLKRVAASWGGDWAPRTAVDGARRWAAVVEQRSIMREVLGDLYREVRYEELRRDPVQHIDALFEWLGLGSDVAAATSAVAACEAGKLRREGNGDTQLPWDLSTEPKDFYREAPIESWRVELKQRDIRLIEFINQRAMVDLDYKLEFEPGHRKPWELTMRDLLIRVFARLVRLIKRRAPSLVKIAEKAVRE